MHFNEFEQPIEHHSELNPELWHRQHLRPEIRLALLRIAQDFVDFVDVPFDLVDVQLSGGMANYNYTDHSDLDLHLIADFARVECDREASEMFDSKRRLYNQHHIRVAGRPVEVYVENSDTPAVSSAYSLLRDQWVREPNPEPPHWDADQVRQGTQTWSGIIQHTHDLGNLPLARRVMHLLKQYRRAGLNSPAGEFSTENLVYKSLRNSQELGQLLDLIDRLHDQSLSTS